MLVKIEARIVIFPGTDFRFPSTSIFRLWSRSPKCRPISARHSSEPPPPDEDLRRWNAAPDAGWRRAHDLTPRSLAIYSPITRLRARPRAHLLRKCHINAHRRARRRPDRTDISLLPLARRDVDTSDPPCCVCFRLATDNRLCNVRKVRKRPGV